MPRIKALKVFSRGSHGDFGRRKTTLGIVSTTAERRFDHHAGLGLIEHAFRKLARKLGIPDALKLYCARHTFGTVAMAETRNPGLVIDVMGHESLDTTMGYLHPETSQIKVVIDRLNQQKYVM